MSENIDGKQMPEKRFSTGAISASVWKNNGTSKQTGEVIEYNTVKLDRRYKDKEGNWQSTSSLRLNDLPKAALVLHKAYEHLVLRQDAPLGAIEEEVAVL